MLQKNGVKENRNLKKDYKHLFDRIPKGTNTVTFQLVKSIYDGKVKRPRSFAIPSSYTSYNSKEDQTNEFIFYTSSRNKNIGGVIQEELFPSSLTFQERGDVTLNLGDDLSENLDKFVWFMNHSRRADSEFLDPSKKPLFFLVDKAQEARSKAERKRKMASMNKFIYDDDSRLKEDDLRIIAKALRVYNVDNLELAEIQTGIESKCYNNPDLFLQMKPLNKEVKMRALLQQATEKGVIRYDNLKEKWFIVNKHEGTESALAPVRKTENEMNALIFWMKNRDDNDSFGKIEELLTGVPSVNQRANKTSSEDDKMRLRILDAENKKEELAIRKLEAQAKMTESKKIKS